MTEPFSTTCALQIPMAAHAGDCIAVLVAAIRTTNNFDQLAFWQAPSARHYGSPAAQGEAVAPDVIPELRAALAIWANGVVAPSLDRAVRMLDTQPRFYCNLSQEVEMLPRRYYNSSNHAVELLPALPTNQQPRLRLMETASEPV